MAITKEFCNIEQILEAVPDKAIDVQPPTTHHQNYPS